MLKFSIRSSTRYLSFLRQLINSLDTVFNDSRIDKECKLKCSLAMIEAVDNAIFHAHKSNYYSWIDISIEVAKNSLIIGIKDSGKKINMPKEFNISEKSTHGRGLFIINEVMDSVDLSFNNGNLLRMKYRLDRYE